MYQIKHSLFIESGIERKKAYQDATTSASTLTQSLAHLHTDSLSLTHTLPECHSQPPTHTR